MKALVVYDPKSKFTLEALKAVEYKLAELENLELVYVADHNHERMENPKEYNLKMEKEGPEWITPEPEVMEQIKDADILMTSFCGVTRAMLETGKNLKLVFMMRSGWENCNVKAAKELGIPVYTELASASIDQSLDNIVEDVRNIGEIFNVQETANSYADELQERIDALMDKVSSQSGEPLKVLFMAGYADGTFVAYNSKMSSCMLNALNAENVLDKGGNGLTLENLVSMNPDIIVYVRADRFGAADADAVEQLTANAVVQEVPAIANQKVIEMDYDDVMDYGARVIDSAETLYNFMYSAS